MHYPTALTNRELEVLTLVAQGKNNRQIAEKLLITIRTVKYHTGNIYSKIGCRSRWEAIAWVWANERTNRQMDDI